MALQPIGGGDDEVLSELREGRTRELLLLLQGEPIPEVVDPMNVQSGLSSSYDEVGGKYQILNDSESTADMPTEHEGANLEYAGVKIAIDGDNDYITATLSDAVGGADDYFLWDSDENELDATITNDGGVLTFEYDFTVGQEYYLIFYETGGFKEHSKISLTDTNSGSYPFTSELVDVVSGYDGEGDDSEDVFCFTSVTAHINGKTSAEVVDKYDAPTTEPADFKQWNAIQARDVSEGGSTSTEPVEFEILDSEDNELTDSRIPKARIADEPFTMRDRVYSEDADSDDQAGYTISETGDGGHFGIDILTISTVKLNGSLIDSANWEYDDDDTVTIDTDEVTISEGDTIEIKYDFDVFDETLQPRAYLNREDIDEESPSISHFRYEYVI